MYNEQYNRLDYLKFAHISPNDRRHGGARQEAHLGDHETYEIPRRHIVVEIKYVQIRWRGYLARRLLVRKSFAEVTVQVVAGEEVLGRICGVKGEEVSNSSELF